MEEKASLFTKQMLQLSDLREKLAKNFQPNIKKFYTHLYRGQVVESILGSVQHWNISCAKALELIRSLLLEEVEVTYPIKSDIKVYDAEHWDTIVVDTVPEEWTGKADYAISGLRAGDKIIVIRETRPSALKVDQS